MRGVPGLTSVITHPGCACVAMTGDWDGLARMIGHAADGPGDGASAGGIVVISRAMSKMARLMSEFRPAGNNEFEKLQSCDDEIRGIERVCNKALFLADRLEGGGSYHAKKRINDCIYGLRIASRGPLFRKGVLLNSLGRHGEAAECLGRALYLKETPDVLNQMGVALTRLGMHDEAGAHLERAMVVMSGYGETVYNLALLEDESGMYHDALERLDWLLEAGRSGEDVPGIPDTDDLFLSKGLVNAHAGDHKDAMGCFERVSGKGRHRAAYHGAGSLYRMGRYAEAADWYGRAVGFGDAKDMQSKMAGMRGAVPDRIRLPLLAAGAPGGVRGMPRLQYIVYMAQLGTGTGEYDFASAEFGPYSEGLARDVADNTEIFRVARGRREIRNGPRTYSLLPEGRRRLEGGEVDGEVGDLISGLCKMSSVGLVDYAYAGFAGAADAGHVREGLGRIISEAERRGKRRTRYHVSVESEARHAMHVLSGLEEVEGKAERRAAVNMGGIIARRCEEIRRPVSSVDHYARGEALADLAEYGSLLLEYSKARSIASYPRILYGGGAVNKYL